MRIESIGFGFKSNSWALYPPKMKELKEFLTNAGAIKLVDTNHSGKWHSLARSSKFEAEFTDSSLKKSILDSWLTSNDFEGWTVVDGVRFKVDDAGVNKTYCFVSSCTPQMARIAVWTDNASYPTWLKITGSKFPSRRCDKDIADIVKQCREHLAELIEPQMKRYIAEAEAKVQKVKAAEQRVQELLLNRIPSASRAVAPDLQIKPKSIWD